MLTTLPISCFSLSFLLKNKDDKPYFDESFCNLTVKFDDRLVLMLYIFGEEDNPRYSLRRKALSPFCAEQLTFNYIGRRLFKLISYPMNKRFNNNFSQIW